MSKWRYLRRYHDARSLGRGIYPPWRENDPQVELWAYYPAGGILLVKEIVNGRERHYTYTGSAFLGQGVGLANI